ncbi:MAG: hypothetical protein EXR72_04595 [Myxococcales bacterium]|nr:hypothetical protein [Myxococcales bacterium]
MFEILIVLGIGALLAACASIYAWFGWTMAFGLSLGLIVFGLAVGVPAGALYHLLLYRRLRARGVLPRRWWLQPLSHHDLLASGERFAVLFWCYLGGLGFVLSIAGCLLLVIGVVQDRQGY